MASQREPHYELVVIGASAGGIDALSSLIASLPRDFAAPIVIAQHLDPRRPSHLSEILSRRSALPVRTVEARTELEPGTVYVVPANRNVEVADHAVSVSEASEEGARPSVDRLLESAAQAYGETLVAVILTGMGSDGTAGARRVKAAGGTVVIQNPDTAAFPDMPRSLPPTLVDIVANLDAIGPIMRDLVSGALTPTRQLDERALTAVLEMLRDRTGVDFSNYKRPTILRRLQRRMAATGTTNLRDYARHVNQHPDELNRLSSTFLIKVTEFFRDEDLFEHLRSTIVPELIAEAREHDRELRLWSAGCATGEEAYSLGMLVAEALGDELPSFNVRIFATDLDEDAVNYARRGVYPADALAAVPAELVERYFTEVDGQYEVRKHLRALTVFGQHDLGQRAPFPRIDLALCRNVLIYFTPDLQKRALQLFAFSLREGGSLVLGKAETTSPLGEFFVLEQPRLKVYRRHGERVLIPPARIRDSAPVLPPRPAHGRSWNELAPARGGREPLARPGSGADRAEKVLLRMPIGVALVDASYDIQWINAAARRFLGIHGPAIGHDLVHLAAPLPPAELRAMIDGAFGGEQFEREYELAPTETLEGRRWANVATYPFHGSDDNGPGELVVVLIRDTTDATEAAHSSADALEHQRALVAQLGTQIQGLSRSYGELLQANQELTTSNAELRSANEELLVANEEVQAATEEVETLNEELQATNEELETLNEELQATVEELNTTNDDLQARTAELLETATTLDEQRRESDAARATSEAALDLVPTPVLLLGVGDRPMLVNRAYRSAFPDGRDLVDENGARVGGADALAALAQRTDGARIGSASADGARRWYRAHAEAIDAPGHERVTAIVLTEAEG